MKPCKVARGLDVSGGRSGYGSAAAATPAKMMNPTSNHPKHPTRTDLTAVSVCSRLDLPKQHQSNSAAPKCATGAKSNMHYLCEYALPLHSRESPKPRWVLAAAEVQIRAAFAGNHARGSPG